MRDFIGYGAKPPQATFPESARVALNVVINYEEGAERNRLDGDQDSEHLGEAVFAVGPSDRDLAQESLFEYGSRVGIWRILEVLQRHDVPPTIFACGLALERNPAVARALSDPSADLVGHGYRWIPPLGLSEAEERADIRKTVDTIQRLTGRPVKGWLTRPPQTLASRRLLVEEGLLYDSTAFNDDLPYFDVVLDRPFLVFPWTLDLNDVRFYRGTLQTGSDFEHYCRDAFDVLYERGAHTPQVMSIGLHARITGRPGRLAGLDRFLTYVREHDNVWCTTRTSIAEEWLRQFAPPGTWNWDSPPPQGGARIGGDG